MTLVFNASPVIVLAKAGLLNTLSQLGLPSLIPQAVVAAGAREFPLIQCPLFLHISFGTFTLRMSISTSTPHGFHGGFWNMEIGRIGRSLFDM